MTYEEFLKQWPDISYINTGVPSKYHRGLWEAFEASKEQFDKIAVDILNKDWER